MAKNKSLKVLSTASVAGMVAAAVVSSQAFAAVDAYSVKVDNDVFQYSKADLTDSFLAAKAGEAAPLYEDFLARFEKASGFYAFHDNKTEKYVSVADITEKYLEAKAAGTEFVVDTYTESKDAKVLEVPTVKKVVVKDGKVVIEEDQQQVALSVESVSAINAKQIQVKFNKPVDATTAKYAGNYYIQLNTDATALALSAKDAGAVISLDGTSTIATISFTNGINTVLGINKSTPFNFKIAGVKDAAGVALASAYTTQLSINDTVAPSLVSTSAAAKTTTTNLTLTFSEPVQTTGAIVYVDGQAGTVQAGDTSNQLRVTTAQNLNAGSTYAVTVLNVTDYAGNFLATNPTTSSVTVTADTNAPTLTNVVVKTDRVIQATFDKAMNLNSFNGSVRLVDAAGNSYLGNAGIVASNPDSTNKGIVNFTLPVGTTLSFNDANVFTGTLFLTNSITDTNGNAFIATSKQITVNKDVVAPTFASTKFVAPGTVYTNSIAYPTGAIVVKFNESVSYNAGAIQLINSSGVITTPGFGVPVVNSADATEIIVPLTGALSAGTYSVIVPSDFAKDLSFATNSNAGATAALTVSTSGDTTVPTIVSPMTLPGDVSAATSLTSGSTIDVKFTDNAGLDLASILNINNYLLNGLPLPTGSYVTNNITTGTATAATAVTATIHIPAGSIAKDSATNVLNVVNIKDLNGNIATPVAFSGITLKDDKAPKLSTATIAANGTLLLGFTEDVTSAAAGNLADFDLTLNGVKVNAATLGLATVAQGVGTDAGKYVITIAGKIDEGVDTNAATTSDNRVYIDVDGSSTYNAGDILVKTGTTAAVGATTININELSSVKVETIATPAVVKDTATAVAGGYTLVGGTTITVK